MNESGREGRGGLTTGFVDLHCHYLPAIDDGVRTLDEGVALLRGLGDLGFAQVVATPHMRTAMFDNDRSGIEAAFARFVAAVEHEPGLPALGVGSEHFFDDVFWGRFSEREIVPYPGRHAALVEFPSRAFPTTVARRFFEMNVRGVRPVLAHPERYDPLFRRTDPLDPLLDAGALPLLDLMSLAGKYGRKPKKAAERMLEEGVYYAAASDSHRPDHVSFVAEGIARLRALVGDSEAEMLLAEHPRRILDGTVVD